MPKYKIKRILVIVFCCLFCCSIFALIAVITLAALTLVHFAFIFLCLFVSLALFLCLYVAISQLTNLYPLNDLPDNNFDKIEEKYLNSQEIVLNIYESDKGIWSIDDDFTFDMRGFFFPKIYICSYFIRNIHYPIINKNKLKLKRLFESLKTDKYTEFKIIFHKKNRSKECAVVKNCKTITFPLRGFLIRSRFYLDVFDRYHKESAEHIRINEKYYNSRK